MKRTANRRAGQTALMFTLGLTMIFGTVGLVTDMGWAYYRKQAAQAAAQSAAVATVKAAMAQSNGVCGTGYVVCQSETACASSITMGSGTSNTDKGCLYAQTNGFTTGTKQKVTIESGNGAYNGVTFTYYAVARVSERIPQLFSIVTGNAYANLTARSIVGYIPATAGGCIYVIAPTGTALTSNGNTAITTGCGVWVNSNSPTAINLSGGNTTITDTNNNTKVQIVGGYSCYGQTTGCITPAPVTGAASAGDPLAGLDPPTDGACTPIPNISSHGTTTISPGTYCGSLSLQGGQDLQLDPGTYIFKSGGGNSCGLSASGSSTLTGSGVFLYFEDNCSVSLTGNGAVNLSAPTSGNYQGILMFQSRTDNVSSQLTGGANQALNGILYFPDSLLQYTGGSSTNINSPAATIIAYNLQLSGNSYIWNAGTSPYLNTFSGYAMLE